MSKIILFLVVGIVLSLIGWYNYAKFVYVTVQDPDFTELQYNEKYFNKYPSWLADINTINIFTAIILIIAIILMIIVHEKISSNKKLIPKLFIIVDAVFIFLIAWAYM